MKEIFLLACCIFLINGFTVAQDESSREVHKTLLSLQSLQTGKAGIELKSRLVARIGKKRQPVANAEILFLINNDSIETSIASIITDKNGVAVTRWSLPASREKIDVWKDTAGYFNFSAKFKGSDTLKSKNKSIAIKELEIRVDSSEKDSIRYLSLSLLDQGEPVAKTEVNILVDRLFSKLKIAEGYTNKRGEDDVEIPMEIPGDLDGNLNFTVMVEDHDLYGSVSRQIALPWGVPVADASSLPKRSLSTPIAPLWMIITFAVLITGVWYHYILIIFRLWRIRKMGENA